MAEETAVAAASPAAVFTQFDGWDADGEPVLLSPPKPAESAPAKAGKEAVDTEADASSSPEHKETQETAGSGKSKTEKRFQELLEKNKTLQRRLEALESKAGEPRPSAETKTAKNEPAQQAQNYADWRKEFKANQWLQKYTADHPGSSYEEGYSALMDHQYEIRRGFETAEQQRAAGLEKVGQTRAKALETYPDFEEVAAPMADKVMALVQNPKVEGVVKRAIMEPDGFHILYALGKDAEIAEKFEKLAIEDPAEAIFLWKSLKAEVRKELKNPAAGEGAESKAEVEPPAATKPRAPKPPSEVGGRGAVTEDTLVSAAKTGDFRAFEAEQTRRALASRR